jgi:hypothetical protein
MAHDDGLRVVRQRQRVHCDDSEHVIVSGLARLEARSWLWLAKAAHHSPTTQKASIRHFVSLDKRIALELKAKFHLPAGETRPRLLKPLTARSCECANAQGRRVASFLSESELEGQGLASFGGGISVSDLCHPGPFEESVIADISLSSDGSRTPRLAHGSRCAAAAAPVTREREESRPVSRAKLVTASNRVSTSGISPGLDSEDVSM